MEIGSEGGRVTESESERDIWAKGEKEIGIYGETGREREREGVRWR